MKKEYLTKLVKTICTIFCLVSVIAGRVYTFHDTEGEALLRGWPFWGAAIVFAVCAVAAGRKTSC